MIAVTVPQRNTSKLAYVNALRGIAILGVVFVHIMEFGSAKQYFAPIIVNAFYQGARGVQLFFVASAFTLWLSMSRRKQEKNPTLNFSIRRIFRIAPMYYVGILFYSLWFTFVQFRPSITTSAILANVTFLHGLNPYWINAVVPGGWSITVEMCFYVFVPFLFKKIQTLDQSIRFIVGRILASCFLSYILTLQQPIAETRIWADFLFYYFPTQLPVFGFGMVLYFLLASTQPKVVRPSTWLLVAGVLLVMLSTGLPYPGAVPAPEYPYFFGIAFMVLAFGLSQYQPKWLVNPVINWIGEISFSLYLVHFAVLYALQVAGHDDFLHPTRMATALVDYGIRFLFVLAVSCLLATFFYRIVEKPFQSIGKKVIDFLEQ